MPKLKSRPCPSPAEIHLGSPASCAIMVMSLINKVALRAVAGHPMTWMDWMGNPHDLGISTLSFIEHMRKFAQNPDFFGTFFNKKIRESDCFLETSSMKKKNWPETGKSEHLFHWIPSGKRSHNYSMENHHFVAG